MLAAGIRRGTILTVAVLIICVLGIVAALRIPVQMIPDLEVRTISVVTGWPGATPQDVEKEILIEQERYLRTLPCRSTETRRDCRGNTLYRYVAKARSRVQARTADRASADACKTDRRPASARRRPQAYRSRSASPRKVVAQGL